MVQNNCIDMNAWYSRVDKPDRPDFVLFDLDPPDGGFPLAIEVAHLIRELLDELGLPGYVDTSGADGIHVVAPITRRSTFEQTYDFAELVSRNLESRHPGEVTTEWLKKKRAGVLVDHRQNGWGKTIASVYSVRPKPGAPVSTPLRWAELTEDVRPRDFSMQVALERVDDPPQKVGFADGKWLHVPGGGAAAEASFENIYLAIAVSNAGSGIAVLHGWHFHPGSLVRVPEHAPLDAFVRLTRYLYVPAG